MQWPLNMSPSSYICMTLYIFGGGEFHRFLGSDFTFPFLSRLMMLTLSLICPADAQLENRRRGSVDEDTLGDYIYADYDASNGLLDREPERDYGPPPLAEQEVYERPPSRVRVPQPPKRTNSYNDFRSRPSNNGGGLGLRGRDACQSGAKTVGHEDQCDLYYECYEGQGFLTSCPNGLMYGGENNFGLLGKCDYPHNVNCQGREGKSKPSLGF